MLTFNSHATQSPDPVEGTCFNFDASGPTLTIQFDTPTEHEIAAIRRGPAEFHLIRTGPLLFFLCRFGDLEWMDAPYSMQLVPAHSRGLPTLDSPHSRFALAVTIVDARAGGQRGARFVTLSPLFSAMLRREALRQLAEPLTRPQYDSAQQAAYRRYPTARAMARDAFAYCRGGD